MLICFFNDAKYTIKIFLITTYITFRFSLTHILTSYILSKFFLTLSKLEYTSLHIKKFIKEISKVL